MFPIGVRLSVCLSICLFVNAKMQAITFRSFCLQWTHEMEQMMAYAPTRANGDSNASTFDKFPSVPFHAEHILRASHQMQASTVHKRFCWPCRLIRIACENRLGAEHSFHLFTVNVHFVSMRLPLSRSFKHSNFIEFGFGEQRRCKTHKENAIGRNIGIYRKSIDGHKLAWQSFDSGISVAVIEMYFYSNQWECCERWTLTHRITHTQTHEKRIAINRRQFPFCRSLTFRVNANEVRSFVCEEKRFAPYASRSLLSALLIFCWYSQRFPIESVCWVCVRAHIWYLMRIW